MHLIHKMCFLAVLHAANLSLGLDMIWFMLTREQGRGNRLFGTGLEPFFFFIFLLLEMESVSRECCSTGYKLRTSKPLQMQLKKESVVFCFVLWHGNWNLQRNYSRKRVV